MNSSNNESQSQVTMQASDGLWQWLTEQHISLAFSTYQTNRLFLVGCKNEVGHLAVNERLFDKPMGLYARANQLIMSTRYSIWQLENHLAQNELYLGCDRLYVPSISYTTGDLNVHDVVLDKHQKLFFINTDFSCLATLHAGYSFQPIWQPPFITKLAAEDKCHLNGLAMRCGEPAFVTACSTSDEPAGWRNHRENGGVVINIADNEIIATGLSMPHSPRWYRDKLWLLNSGTGELGYLDANQFIPITFCLGFVRGLAFYGDYALVGLSKLRSKSFSGLPLETRLIKEGKQSQCGLVIININTGNIVHYLNIDRVVEELFDVVVLPKVRLPQALGFQNDDIERLISFPHSNGIITTKPTVNRPSLQDTQIAGLPRASSITHAPEANVKYQRVYHLNPENLTPYDAMTYPSLQARWQSQPQRGELLGVSASIDGNMVGFAVAELISQSNATQTAELLSLYVLPIYRRRGIGTTLINQLQQLVKVPFSHLTQTVQNISMNT